MPMQNFRRLGAAWCWPILFLVVSASHGGELVAAKKTAAIVADSECWDCHEAEFKSRKKGLPKEWVGVKKESFARSAHGSLACVECHNTITEPEHPSKLPKVQCQSCHEKSAAKHAFHPRLAFAEVPKDHDTACAECHDSHEMPRVKDPAFAFAGAAQTEACGRCH